MGLIGDAWARIKIWQGADFDHIKARADKKYHPYILDNRAVKGLHKVIDFCRDAITTQSKAFEDLDMDLKLIERTLYGDDWVEAVSQDESEQKKNTVLAWLKSPDTDRADKIKILENLYNHINHSRLDEKPGFVQWGGKRKRTMLREMYKRSLSNAHFNKSIHKIFGRADEGRNDPFIAEQISDFCQIKMRVNDCVSAVQKAYGRCDYGYNEISNILCKSYLLLQKRDSAEFDKEFTDFLDDLVRELDHKIERTHATKEQIQEWRRELGGIEALLENVCQRQHKAFPAQEAGHTPEEQAQDGQAPAL